MNSLIKAVWFVAALSLTTMGFGGITHPTACAQDLVGGESIAQEEVVAEGALRFTRVHVPRGMLNDIPLGSTRYVPMTLREFDQALAKWSLAKPATTVVQLPPEASVAARDQRPLAIQAVPFSVQYTATLSADGLLEGTLEFVLGPGECSLFSEMPLGSLDVRRGTVRTAAGTGEALIFAHPGGGMALATKRSVLAHSSCHCFPLLVPGFRSVCRPVCDPWWPLWHRLRQRLQTLANPAPSGASMLVRSNLSDYQFYLSIQNLRP